MDFAATGAGEGKRGETTLLTEKLSHTMAVESPARENTSRDTIDRRWLLPLAPRRDAVADCATCFDLRMAVRTVAALFAAAMETTHTGYWKISSCAAINGYEL
jgi:hypothetical protein